MRIPSAHDYFGQRIAQVIPVDDIDSARAMALSKGKSDLSGIAALKELEKIGKIGTEIGLKEIEHEGKMRLIEEIKIQKEQERIQKEKEAELKQALEKEKHSKLQTEIIKYKDTLEDAAFTIFNSKDIPDDQKLQELERVAKHVKEGFVSMLGKDAYILDPVHEEALRRAKDKFRDLQLKKSYDQSRANVLAMLDALEKRAAKSPEDRQEAIAILEAAEFYGFNEQEKQKIIQEFKERTAINEIMKRLNDGDYKDVLSDLKAVDSEGNPIYWKALDPKNREHLISTVQDRIEQEERRKEADRKAKQAEWERSMRELLLDYKDMKRSGFYVDPEYEWKIRKAVKGTKFESLFLAIKKQTESLEFITKGLEKDPLAFGAARLGTKITPLNLSSPETLPQQLQQRMAIGLQVREAHNLTYTPVLTTGEIKGLTELLRKQQTGGVQTIQQLLKIVGKNAMIGIAKQVAVEDTQMGMMIAFTARGKADIATTIVEGNQYIKKKIIKLPKEDDLRGKFDDLVGNAFLGLPENSNAYYEAFKAFYTSRAARKGIIDGIVDNKIVKEAFTAVVGNVAEIKGKKFILPDGYSEDRFKNSIKLITADIIKRMGGVYGMTDEEAAEVIRNDAQWFMTERPNTYRVVVNGRYLITKNGNYVEFVFN